MPLIPGLIILGPVLFAGLLLIALSQASSAATRPHQENPGISSAFTWATDVIGNLWHRIVRSTVSHFAASHLVPIAHWFTGLNTLALGLLRLGEDASGTAVHVVERLTGHTIPQAAKKAARPAITQAKAAHTTATKANAKASSTSTALAHYRVKTDHAVHHATVAVDVAIPQQLGRIRTRVGRAEGKIARDEGRIGELENGARSTWDWIRTHPLSSVTAAFGAAVAVGLSRLGFGIFRCRDWQRLGRSLKCSDANVLADLLAAATLSVGLLSLVELAKEEQAVIGGLATAVRDVLEV